MFHYSFFQLILVLSTRHDVDFRGAGCDSCLKFQKGKITKLVIDNKKGLFYIKTMFHVQLVFTSGVPGMGFCSTVVSVKTAGRGKYCAVILATLVGVGTTCVEVKLSLSTIPHTSSCKEKEALFRFI